ncbi:MAG: glucose-1-phosphate adenylyltransferase [Deltaproteobacteria bacterium]|nr:glucose-1-phosphate adenylyltransferase [Deltaproteobacteria bacterium]
MPQTRTVVMVMAGGKGSRLGPLTCHRAKPGVPFAGRYRIIDFVLSNFVNSGYRRIYVLTQYMASSLIKHINRNWHLGGLDHYIEIAPAQMRMGSHWYRGTADAITQNMNLILDARADHVAVFGGDHVYKFDVRQMEEFHKAVSADLSIAACPVPIEEASSFGVIQVDAEGRIIGFQEKPANPAPIPGRPGTCLVSMGNYLFGAKVLMDALIDDAADEASSHDFGNDVIPRMLAEGKRLYAYDFGKNVVSGEPDGSTPYWRDVGTVESYVAANMDVRSPVPTLNLYNRRWRIRSAQRDYPPARFTREAGAGEVAVDDSLVCEGSIVVSATLERTLLGYDSYVHVGANMRDCITLSGCNIGARADLRNVLLDKNCDIAPGARIGLDPEEDRRRFPFVTAGGIVVLPKGTYVPASGPVEFAGDMGTMLENDPATKDAMAALDGNYRKSDRRRHSYESSGPRYSKYRAP